MFVIVIVDSGNSLRKIEPIIDGDIILWFGFIRRQHSLSKTKILASLTLSSNLVYVRICNSPKELAFILIPKSLELSQRTHNVIIPPGSPMVMVNDIKSLMARSLHTACSAPSRSIIFSSLLHTIPLDHYQHNTISHSLSF